MGLFDIFKKKEPTTPSPETKRVTPEEAKTRPERIQVGSGAQTAKELRELERQQTMVDESRIAELRKQIAESTTPYGASEAEIEEALGTIEAGELQPKTAAKEIVHHTPVGASEEEIHRALESMETGDIERHVAGEAGVVTAKEIQRQKKVAEFETLQRMREQAVSTQDVAAAALPRVGVEGLQKQMPKSETVAFTPEAAEELRLLGRVAEAQRATEEQERLAKEAPASEIPKTLGGSVKASTAFFPNESETASPAMFRLGELSKNGHKGRKNHNGPENQVSA